MIPEDHQLPRDTDVPPIRSIGSGNPPPAESTGRDLAVLAAEEGLHLFPAVSMTATAPPLQAHALAGGGFVIFVATVRWPPGAYHVDSDDRIHCDSLYIGQSVRPVRVALALWRDRLPRHHQVSAFVVVHPDGPGDYALPAGSANDLAWAMADAAVCQLRNQLPQRRGASRRALLVLAAATQL